MPTNRIYFPNAGTRATIVAMQSLFVIQLHQTQNGNHFDLMLEQGQSLLTFQMPLPLCDFQAGQELSVTRLPDHRKLYLTYEGEISDGRGQVHIVDRGRYQMAEKNANFWVIIFSGQQAQGVFCIRDPSGPYSYIRRLGPN